MYKLAPSILSADFGNLGSEVMLIDKAGADYIHIDMMDGVFVPNISLGIPVVKSIRKYTDKVFDVHFMLEHPIHFIDSVAAAGADLMTIHIESGSDVRDCIGKIRAHNCKVGLAISPDTPIFAAEKYLEEIDLLLIMSVYPGFGGQAFLPEAYEKIREAKRLVEEKNLSVEIEVDGGVNWRNVEKIARAGADVIVAGSLVFDGNAQENVRRLKRLLHSQTLLQTGM